MKCLSPLKIVNPKYNGDHSVEPGQLFDYYLYVPCGRCFECLKQKAANWKSRLFVEHQHSKRSVFLTFTIDEEHLPFAISNSSLPIRRFFELYRRYFGKSCKHFFVTEIGEGGRLHYHGIMFDFQCDLDWIHQHWNYGFVWSGWCNQRTIGYIVKYITKPQSDVCPEWYYPKTFCSPGLGKSFLSNENVVQFHQRSESQLIRIGTCKYTIPRYYRDKIFDRDVMRKHYYDQLLYDFENGYTRFEDGLVFTDPKSYYEYKGLMKHTYDRIGGMKKSQINPVKRKKHSPTDVIKDFISSDFN